MTLVVAARFAVAIPLVAALGWLGSWAVSLSRADTQVLDASKEMGAWAASRMQPQTGTWESVRGELAIAEKLSPTDPAIHELVGVLNASRPGEEEYLTKASVNFARAASMRPVSPYTWANLAEVNYKTGITGGPFLTALRRAVELGPNEPEVQRMAANFGLAVWDELRGDDRQSVDRMVAAGLRRNPLEMLQISEGRGRLAVACRHLVGTARAPDPKWYQLCQSTEATP